MVYGATFIGVHVEAYASRFLQLGTRTSTSISSLGPNVQLSEVDNKAGRPTDKWKARWKAQSIARKQGVLPYGVGDLGEDPACCGLITGEAYLGWRQHEGQLAKRLTSMMPKEEKREIER